MAKSHANSLQHRKLDMNEYKGHSWPTSRLFDCHLVSMSLCRGVCVSLSLCVHASASVCVCVCVFMLVRMSVTRSFIPVDKIRGKNLLCKFAKTRKMYQGYNAETRDIIHILGT